MNYLIVGATSGIGRRVAERLAAEGHRVGIVGRREELLREIAAQHPQHFRCERLDVAQTDCVAPLLDRLAAALGGVDVCLVAAGVGELNPALDSAVEQRTIRTNVAGWTAVVDWAFDRFMKQGGGHLVVVTSVGGLRGGAAAPAYNASKAWQINYAEGLRLRAAKARLPIRITDIRPGLVDTAMAQGEGLFWVMPVDRVAEQLLRAVRRGRRVAVVTRRWRIAAWLLRHLPERFL